MNMMICTVLPAVGFPDSYTADFTLLASPALIRMTSARSSARWAVFSMSTVRANEPILAGVSIAWTGPPCEGNSNLMIPAIAAAATTTTPPRASQSR